MTDDEFENCVGEIFTEFKQYDTYVDVVSAWEEFLTNQYEPAFDNFHFDRFPEDTKEFNGQSIGPTFTVLFNDRYGILFSVFESLPRDETDLKALLNELKDLDTGYGFRTGNGGEVTPEQYDVSVLIGNENAQTAEHLVNNLLSDNELKFDSNLVLLSYRYKNQDTNPKYEFSRLSMVDQNFRDDVLPKQRQISRVYSMEDGGFETIDSPPGFFKNKRSTGVLCNKKLSEPYFACYLWHYAFTDYLTRAEEIVWQEKDPKKMIEFDITIDELYDDVRSKYIPVEGVKKEWVRKALEFLCVTGVAEQSSNDEYTIKFRNLHDKRREHKDVVTKRSEIADLAYLFASWHCESVVDMSPGERAKHNLGTTEVDLSDDITQPELGEW